MEEPFYLLSSTDRLNLSLLSLFWLLGLRCFQGWSYIRVAYLMDLARSLSLDRESKFLTLLVWALLGYSMSAALRVTLLGV